MSLSAKNLCSTCRPSGLALICMALAASPGAFAAAPSAPAGDLIFTDGFDGAQASISTYDDLVEGFLDTTFDYNDVHYHDVNGIGGVFPDGGTFTADDFGNLLIIEDATVFYNDFPDYGSSPNSLTFGTAFVGGPNVSIGALTRVTMDLIQPASAASVDLGYYENGVWGRIVIHLDAMEGDTVVATDSLTIADGGGRDNGAVAVLSVEAATFDTLKLYATYDDQPSAPRVMIDNLALTPVVGSSP